MKVLLFVLLAATTYSFAQNSSPKVQGWRGRLRGGKAANSALSQKGYDRIVKEVRHELVMLPRYDVFDDLSYQVRRTARLH